MGMRGEIGPNSVTGRDGTIKRGLEGVALEELQKRGVEAGITKESA